MIQDTKSVYNILKGGINGKNTWWLLWWIKRQGYYIDKLPLDTSPLSSNAWLAGFIDGDFAIKGFTENKSHLAIQFNLSQRTDRSGVSLEKVMLQIAEFLSTKLESNICYTPRGGLPPLGHRYEQFIVNTSNGKSVIKF